MTNYSCHIHISLNLKPKKKVVVKVFRKWQILLPDAATKLPQGEIFAQLLYISKVSNFSYTSPTRQLLNHQTYLKLSNIFLKSYLKDSDNLRFK